MLQIMYLFCLLHSIRRIDCKLEPFVVGGKTGTIEKFPHAVFLNIICQQDENKATGVPWICGASIINQYITLTAAHCVAGCFSKSLITISVGHMDKTKANGSIASGYKIHSSYRTGDTANDIALIKRRTPLIFGEGVKRVVLMANPPYFEKAQIAGWGFTSDDAFSKTNDLQYTDQQVLQPKECRKLIPSIPAGTICASGDNGSYAARGDSGSALVVRGYIQIGIVSYKMPKVSRSLVVYTDTGYFYEWIKKNSRRLYCA